MGDSRLSRSSSRTMRKHLMRARAHMVIVAELRVIAKGVVQCQSTQYPDWRTPLQVCAGPPLRYHG